MCLVISIIVAGCSTAPQKPESRMVLGAEVNEAIAIFKAKDPGIERFFQKSYGYAVFPKVLKAGFWFAGAYGKGQVYEQGKMVGYCDMKSATLGATVGGEYFREIIFFREKVNLDRFKLEEYTFSAQVTAVAANAGAALKADYKDGMAVFITTDKGLMADVSAGGQKFNYLSREALKDR